MFTSYTKALQRDTKRYHSKECIQRDIRVNKGQRIRERVRIRESQEREKEREREKEQRKKGKAGNNEPRQKGKKESPKKKGRIRSKKKVGFFFLSPHPKKSG
jgi:hypothetical protein